MDVFLSYVIAGNTLYDYLIMILIFFVVYFVILIFRRFIIRKMRIMAEKSVSVWDDIIVKNIASISKVFYIVILIYLPLQYIQVNDKLLKILNFAFLAIVLRELVNIINNIIKHILEETIHKKNTGKKDKTKINLFNLLIKIVVYVTAGLFLLSNIGIEITPLIASLGVAGIAVAFALQKILGDVFASFSIFLDKPFEVGDFVIIGSDSGNIKDIGIKSTRIQTLQGQELIVPNAEMTSVRVNNYGKMKKRRVVFGIGVVYQTNPSVLEKIPTMIQKIIEKSEYAEFARAHFVEFGPSSLNFEIAYYIISSDYKIYRDTHQSISLDIIKEFKQKGISFAYPTQSIFIESNK